MDERDRAQRDQGDEVPQDGLGRDTAHGGDRPSYQGGSYGRDTGSGGGDLLGIDVNEGRRDPAPGASRSEDARGAPGGADVRGGTDERTADPGRGAGGADDLDDLPDVGRREPGR